MGLKSKDGSSSETAVFDRSDFYFLFKIRRTMSVEESSGTNSAKPLEINVVALRQALRLIHCLQKERGASCAYHASTSLFHKHLTVEPARRDTDRALRKASMCMNSHNARAVLEKIRKATQSQGVSYHRILATYNCLISAIVHDGIWKHTNTQRVKNNAHDDSSSSSTVKHDNVPVRRHRRAPSSSDVLLERDKSSSLLLDKKKPVHRRLQSENFRGRLATDPTDYSFLTSEMKRVNGVSDHNTTTKPMSRIDSIGSEPLEEPAETAKGNPQASSIDTSVNSTDSEAPNLSRLLTLLETFVALTESIGVERATLCSILAAGPESHHLLNDMVLEVENQRRLVQKLLKSKVGSLCHGVKDLVVMSPQLEEIQQRLLAGKTDGIGQEIDSYKLWNMLTVYIDKLHSFELLILEEIEYALEESKDEIGQEGVHWSAVFGKYDRIEKLKDIVESTPPDDVKGKVMAALRNEVGQHFKMPEEDFINVQSTGDTNDGNTSEENRLDAMLKELSSFPQSKEWEIDLYQIRFKKRIGQGAAGTTYMADWGGTRVAVKVASITEMGLEGWRTEVQALQKLHHPNIIRLLGSVYHPNPLTFCLVLEYCDAGDLDTAMQRVTPRNFVPHVALSMAKGMAYLHKRGIIHRDVKPLNVLLNGYVSGGHFEVKVTDFGVATEYTQEEGGLRTAETGTYRWMAPEVIRHEVYSETADVFSFGVVLWQLVTRELPYEDRSTFEAAAAVAMESLRPHFPDGTPTEYKKLVEDCWQDDPSKRPQFDDVVEALLDMEKTHSEEEASWFEAPLGHPAYRKVKERKSKGEKVVAEELKPDAPHKNKDKAHPKPGRLKSLFARKSSHF